MDWRPPGQWLYDHPTELLNFLAGYIRPAFFI
jgi:hypothetical protein